jgi:hypothetical protein
MHDIAKRDARQAAEWVVGSLFASLSALPSCD